MPSGFFFLEQSVISYFFQLRHPSDIPFWFFCQPMGVGLRTQTNGSIRLNTWNYQQSWNLNNTFWIFVALRRGRNLIPWIKLKFKNYFSTSQWYKVIQPEFHPNKDFLWFSLHFKMIFYQIFIIKNYKKIDYSQNNNWTVKKRINLCWNQFMRQSIICSTYLYRQK